MIGACTMLPHGPAQMLYQIMAQGLHAPHQVRLDRQIACDRGPKYCDLQNKWESLRRNSSSKLVQISR
jgi:hypothetical protein